MTPIRNSRPTDNGDRLYVETSVYTGLAGVRMTDWGGEFAAFGDVPARKAAVAADKVDGRLVRVLSARQSAIDSRMLVVRFGWIN